MNSETINYRIRKQHTMHKDNMTKALTVYKASAGSGKTFTLAVHYIKLVVSNPQAYRNILAVTFTNKATEEMKNRILSQLYGIWKQLPDSDDYTKAVCTALDASPQYVSERAGLALQLLLHNYNHFRVMTIDTFFQSILRNMARELDLTANLRIGLNDSQVEEMAVDQLIDGLKTTDTMLMWILKYIMENISDDKSWNVIGQIKLFGKNIFRDYYKDISKTLNEKLQQKGFFDNYTKTLRTIRQNAKERMEGFADEFFAVINDEGLDIEDLANKRRGIASFFYKLKSGVFDDSIENATVANCLGNPTKWYAKTHPRRELIHTLADGRLGAILRQAVEERPRQWNLYQSATLTLRHLNQVRLLNSIENKVHALNEEANRFLLSDTQKMLHDLIGDSDTPFIFEKMGTQLEHVLIDEFQDTSILQWRNFKVLLQEAMSHQGSENLIVGDVKQSIYRWRGGDWRLLNNIEQQFPAHTIITMPLKTNRRSERRVIDFNNAFFLTAAKEEYTQLNGMPEAEQLKHAYEDVEQLIPDSRPDLGYVEVELLTGDDYKEQTLCAIADTVSSLVRRHIPQSRIAILVRTNLYISLIANYLSECLPSVNIISDEAFRLDASMPVNIIVQALRLITRPDDQLARAFLEKTTHNLALFNDQRLGYYNSLALSELTEQLFDDLELQRYESQSGYLCAFFDYMQKYCTENAATIDGFLREWDSDIRAKTIQSDQTDGIRIISIHKSKGLEFDHVICPFCDWQLEKTGNILWCHPREAPFNALPLAPVDYSPKGMKGTIYEGDYHTEHLQNIVDNLNLLYVAFTRARSSLHILGRRGARNSRSDIIERVFSQWSNGHDATLSGFTLSGLDDEQSPVVFKYGTVCSATEESRQSETNDSLSKKHDTENPFLLPSAPLPISVSSQPLKVEFKQSNQSQDFVRSDESEADANTYIQLGNILHHVFSTIRTTDDIDNALRQLEQDGVLYDDQITLSRITGMLRKRLEHPKVADWFSNRWTLFNECTILVPATDGGSPVERRPDRVMTDGHQWVVVDFKFGHPHNDYHDQVREYMHLLSAMYPGTNVSGYLWFVYSNKIEEVSKEAHENIS